MKKIIGLIMIGVLSITPAYAAVESTTSLTAPGTSETAVYADIDAKYTVTLPKVTKLDSATKASDYTVKVQGDIVGTDSVIVEPETSFTMHTNGKDGVTATVSQTKTKFEASEITGDGTTITGSVAAQGLTAGSWNGSFNFYVQLRKASGLYKADGSMVTWQKLLNDGTLKVQDGELTSGYIVSSNSSASALTGTLVVDDSVTSLGDHALSDCGNLTGIVIPSSVTTIKEYALKNTGITELTIPVSVTTLTTNAASMMEKLETLTVNCSDETFNTSFLLSDKNIKNVIFNGSYKKIGDLNSTKVKYIKLPKDLESIPSCSSSSLETIVLQSKIKTIKSFSSAGSLRSIDLSQTEITEIPTSCFFSCTSLTDVKLPDTLKTINMGGFDHCTALTLTVPDTVTTIGVNAFSNVKQVTYHGSAADTAGDHWGALALN